MWIYQLWDFTSEYKRISDLFCSIGLAIPSIINAVLFVMSVCNLSSVEDTEYSVSIAALTVHSSSYLLYPLGVIIAIPIMFLGTFHKVRLEICFTIGLTLYILSFCTLTWILYRIASLQLKHQQEQNLYLA